MSTREQRYYTKDHNPKYWGFFLWNGLEAQLESYPEHDPTPEEQQELRSWILLCFRKIPCLECRDDALQLLKKYPIATTSQAAAKQWLYFIHNMVNEKMGRPALSPKEAREHSQLVRRVNWSNVWSDLKNDKLNVPSSPWKTYGYMAFLLLFIVFVAVFVVWMKDTGNGSSTRAKDSPIILSEKEKEKQQHA
jgi:hypothetical protein